MASNTLLINVSADDDFQLLQLEQWTLNIDWCSRAIFETFSDYTMISGISDLVINSEGELTISEGSLPLTTYHMHSNFFNFTTLSGGNFSSRKFTFLIDAETVGSGQIMAEFATTSPNWFTFYDTANDLDLSNIVKRAGDGNLGPSRVFQTHISITTDENGYGGLVRFYGIALDPSLNEVLPYIETLEPPPPEV